jgi:TatD DNase family protein
MLIDTHCHLNFKVFKGKVNQVIDRAKKAGIEKIIVPGVDLKTSKKAVELAQKYDGVYAAVGIHPHHSNIKNHPPAGGSKIKNELKTLAENKKVVAVGECGLDYYQYQKTKYQDYQIDDDFKKRQKEILLLQIGLAKELNLPLIIHSRQASEDILKIIKHQTSAINHRLKGVFHCFEGNEDLLKWGLENSFYFGVTGNLTYNHKIQSSVKKIPLKNLLIETDSPFLIPEPLKSQKIFPNEPKNVKIVAKRIAKIKGDSFLNIGQKTTQNAICLFKL